MGVGACKASQKIVRDEVGIGFRMPVKSQWRGCGLVVSGLLVVVGKRLDTYPKKNKLPQADDEYHASCLVVEPTPSEKYESDWKYSPR